MTIEDHQTLAGILDKLDSQANLLRATSSAFYQTGNALMGERLGDASDSIRDQVKALEKLRAKVTDDAYRASQEASRNMLDAALAVAQTKA